MLRRTVIGLALFLAVALAPLPSASGEDVLLRDTFEDLSSWSPYTFDSIDKHTVYTVERTAQGSALRTESHASASGLRLTRTWNVKDFPMLRFRWKVDNIYKTGDATRKSGDDFPLRVYVVFGWDGVKMNLGDLVAKKVAEMFSDEDAPHSALVYIWANREHDEAVLVSPYTDRSRMIPLRSGAVNTGRWLLEERNIAKDYRMAFDREPPATATLAIMNDADNTGETAVSWLDFIEIFTLKDDPAP